MLARKNVKINGQWEDHLMLAILEDDWLLSTGGTIL